MKKSLLFAAMLLLAVAVGVGIDLIEVDLWF